MNPEHSRSNSFDDLALHRELSANVASMKESQDLFRLVGLVEESLKGLGVRCDRVGINTVDEEAGVIRCYDKIPGKVIQLDIHLPLEPAAGFYARWKAGQTWHRHWTEADFRLWSLELLKTGYLSTEEEMN